jgi:hypothetical protein
MKPAILAWIRWELKTEYKPEGNSIIVVTDSRNDAVIAMGRYSIPEDVTVKPPFVCFVVALHVIRVDEISSRFVRGKGLGEAL